MNCERARLLIGAEPYVTAPELAEHLASCAECKQFQTEMISLENDLRRALEGLPATANAPALTTAAVLPSAASPTAVAPVAAANAATASATNVTPFRAPAGSPSTVQASSPAQGTSAAQGPAPARHRAFQRTGWAVAASVLALATLSVWIFRPTDTLAHEVVLHVNHEAPSWNSSTPVNAHDLQDILQKSGVTLKVTSDDVTYARTCYFRGHFVPHLVMSTTTGPVTLLALPDEHVRARESFKEGGFSGVIVPAEHGSIALLARDGADIDAVADKLAH